MSFLLLSPVHEAYDLNDLSNFIYIQVYHYYLSNEFKTQVIGNRWITDVIIPTWYNPGPSLCFFEKHLLSAHSVSASILGDNSEKERKHPCPSGTYILVGLETEKVDGYQDQVNLYSSIW